MGADHEPRMGDRSLFPDLESRVYLNHGAISPPSLPVRAAIQVVMDAYARRGMNAFLAYMEQREVLRARLAGLIGARPEDLAYVPNTTGGVQAVALCFPWDRGDRILCFRGEFPANVTPWQQAAALFGLELKLLELPGLGGGDRFFDRLEDALRLGARMVAISAVQFQTGLRMPLREISQLCHRHGAQLFVDGIQAVGAVPVDVRAMGIDYLSCGSHKWLMGPEGAAFLYAAPGRVQALRPALAGWLSHDEGLRFLFEGEGHLLYDRPVKTRIEFLEAGAPNTLGLAGLDASSRLIETLGVDAIYAHLSAWLDLLEQALVERGFRNLRSHDPQWRSGILAVQVPPGGDVLKMVAGLGERGISVTAPDGNLRFAPHWPNGLEQVAEVIEAIDHMLA